MKYMNPRRWSIALFLLVCTLFLAACSRGPSPSVAQPLPRQEVHRQVVEIPSDRVKKHKAPVAKKKPKKAPAAKGKGRPDPVAVPSPEVIQAPVPQQIPVPKKEPSRWRKLLHID